MSIVAAADQSGGTRAPKGDALLEAVVLHPRDVAGAAEGGVDRIFLLTDVERGGLSPEPAVVSSVRRETDLPLRVLLRLNDGLSTTGGELVRLAGLAEDYLAIGAQGVVFGFLDSDLEVDVQICASLAERLREVPWTFSRVIDAALSMSRAWRQLQSLPGLDAVSSAGSPRGMNTGFEDLVDLARSDPSVAALLMAGGGLRGEHVPWLVRAGVRQFQVGPEVRPGGSWKSYVDAAHVRSWRMLLDDALDLARDAAQRSARA